MTSSYETLRTRELESASESLTGHLSLVTCHCLSTVGPCFMQKGENIVSIALAAVVLLAVVAVQRRWNPADLKDVANSAEDFILTTTGIGGQVPDIAGYERLKTFPLGQLSRRPVSRHPRTVDLRPGTVGRLRPCEPAGFQIGDTRRLKGFLVGSL